MTREELQEWLRETIADLLEVDPDEVDIEHPLNELGISSRDAVGLVADIEDHLDIELDATLLYRTPTIAALAAELLGEQDGGTAGGAAGTGDAAPAAAAQSGPAEATGDAGAIAVVGVGVRLPGGVEGPQAAWDALLAGRDLVGTVPEGRWDVFASRSPEWASAVAKAGVHGGFMPDIDMFDPEFFGITPAEALQMDPQQRQLLEVTWEALEHAGIDPATLRGTPTGVFVGLANAEYGHFNSGDLPRVEAVSATGAAMSIAANRISYVMDLRGPSIASDTACSASLSSLHQAVQSLRNGECTTAVVGGSNTMLTPAPTIGFRNSGALAADGRCKPFSADADGIVRAEAVGVVVLKRLRDAVADGDRVLAVVRQTLVNSDGRSNGLTAPNPAAQADLLREVYDRAGIDPHTVDYVETHGTGTLLGDPIEADALGKVLGRGRPAGQPLRIGSIKSNIGHAEGAAGIVSFIKLVLALHHGTIPASLHFSAPNPHIPFEESRLSVVTEPTGWTRYGGDVARAGVSAFGFGGTNVHAVLEEYPATTTEDGTGEDDGGVTTLLLSAPNEARVRAGADALAQWLEGERGTRTPLRDLAHTLARHRTRAAHRGAVTGRTREELLRGLHALAAGTDVAGVVKPFRAPAAPAADGPVWVFSGYGSQWAGMAKGLLADPEFGAAIDEIDAHARELAGWSVKDMLAAGTQPEGVAETQLTVFAVQVALARLWRSWGVRPAAVLGHSMGEVAAAVVSGALSVRDGVTVMTVRSTLLEEVGADRSGAMAVLAIGADEVEAMHEEYPDVVVAVRAAPQQCTVAGDADQVRALAARVEAGGGNAWLLDVTGAGHSPAVEPVLGRMTERLADIRGAHPQVPFYSTVNEDPRLLPDFDAAYWARNARHAVRFTDAVAAALADGHRVFLEVSPHPVTVRAIRATVAEALDRRGVAGTVVLGTLRRDTDDETSMRAAVARLHLAGMAVDVERLVPAGRLVDTMLPAWQHERYMADATIVHGGARRKGPSTRSESGHPLLGPHVEDPVATGDRHLFRSEVGLEAAPWVRDHEVFGSPVLPGAAYADLALAAAAEVLDLPAQRLRLTQMELERVLTVRDETPVTTAVRLDGERVRVAVYGHAPGAGNGGRKARRPMLRYATAEVEVLAGDDAPEAMQSPAAAAPVDLYGALDARGLGYGPAFTGLADSRADSEGNAVAGVVPAAVVGDSAGHVVHPVVLDLCLQTLGVGVLGIAQARGEELDLHIPFAIGSLRVLGDTSGGGTCVASVRDLGAAGKLGTVQLLGSDGEVLLEARDVLVRSVQRHDVPVPVSDVLFGGEWEDAPALPPAADRGAADPLTQWSGSWLVVCADGQRSPGGLADRVAGVLSAAGHRVVTDPAELDGVSEQRPSGVVLVAADAAVGPQASLDRLPQDRQGVLTAVAGIRALAEAVSHGRARQGSRVLLVTRGGAGVAGETVDPGQAALRGVLRTAVLELPELSVSLVDLDPAGAHSGTAVDLTVARLVSELVDAADKRTKTSADDEVAWRGDRRLARRLRRVDEPDTPVKQLREGSHIITGGLGGLGLVIARWLTGAGATRVVLSGRSAPSEAAQRTIEELRSTGCEIVVERGDIAEPGVAERLVAVAEAGGTPLRGVLHAAGTLRDQGLVDVDAAAVEHVWAPKAVGAVHLHEATAGRDLDLFMVFSSAAALMGSPGQTSYSSANAWLDGLVQMRRAQGLAGTSIQWGAWAEVGGAAHAAGAADSLLEPLAPRVAVEAMEAVLGTGRPVTGVVRLTPQRAVEMLPGLVNVPFLAPLLAAEIPATEDDDDWPGVEALRRMAVAEARRLVADRLAERMGTVMGMSPERIDTTVSMTSLGVDSLMAVRARNAVEHDLGITLPARLLLQGASLDDLRDYLLDTLGLGTGEMGTSRSPRSQGGASVAPRDSAERYLVTLWEEALGTSGIGVTTHQDELGLGTAAKEEIARALRRRLDDPSLDVAELFVGGTIEAQADMLRERLDGNAGKLVRVLREGTGEDALFVFHPAGGPTSVYTSLVEQLDGTYAVYGLERLDDVDTIEEKAAVYIDHIRELCPQGPYRLAGWSLGGALAYEVARQLRDAGDDVDIVIMIDTIRASEDGNERDALRTRYERYLDMVRDTYGIELDVDVEALLDMGTREQVDHITNALGQKVQGLSHGVIEHQRTSYIDGRIYEQYRPGPYDGRVVLFRATERGETTTLDPRYQRADDTLGWGHTGSHLEIIDVVANHTSIIDRPAVDPVAARMRELLAQRERENAGA